MKIIIKYQANLSKPEGLNHICTDDQITGESSKEFNNYEDAMDFWFECTFPLTDIQDLHLPGIDPEVAKQVNTILKQREKARAEELLTSQEPLYAFSEEDSLESYLTDFNPEEDE
jgi:hypothetical protein